MIALGQRKFSFFFCIFLVWLRARITPIQAWNIQRDRSISNTNTRACCNENATKVNLINNMSTPITCQILSSSSRRHVLSFIPPTLAASASLFLAWPTPPSPARNMPVSNGADTSKVGTVSALLPIIKLRTDIETLRKILQERHKMNVQQPWDVITKTKTAISFTKSEESVGSGSKSTTILAQEKDFKRLFDAYSDQVSYKQKFLDQNAFLVYYTNGYDGPGRDSLEKDPTNERQTLQFGARNEAWISWDNFLAEWEYYTSASRRTRVDDDIDNSFLDMLKYLSNTVQAVDKYLELTPPQDLQAAQEEIPR